MSNKFSTRAYKASSNRNFDKNKTSSNNTRVILFSIMISVIVIFIFRGYMSYMYGTFLYHTISSSNLKQIKAITWNIAAVNKNPFEYWITNEDPNYNRIMKSVSISIDSPAENDVQVKEIFTDTMYDELEKLMVAAEWNGISKTRKQWELQYKNRKVISEFIKDSLLGKKRLASMPDRVTNSITTVNESIIMRPSVINCYDTGDLSTIDKWWIQWREFMFSKDITIKKHGKNKTIKIKDMLSKIKKSKYPSITTEEEEISIPLQTLCAAIFDAILIDMMNKIDNKNWQPLRKDICMKLNSKKTSRTIEILEKSYINEDIIFLQEVAGSFLESLQNRILYKKFDILYPVTMDSDRDQNSFILLKKGLYRDIVEVTEDVLKELDTSKHPVPIAHGDLLAITAVDIKDNSKYIFASFHGDTNGLATIPIVHAIHKYALTKRPDHKILFGLDANTYYNPESDQQGMTEFAQFYVSKNLNSCHGLTPNPLEFTTFHARTHLQPQLNKAVKLDEKDLKGDKNPKDFILFFQSDFSVISTNKDNTGEKKYIENMVFPTLSFPSDHGILSTILREEIAVSTTDNQDKTQSNNLRKIISS